MPAQATAARRKTSVAPTQSRAEAFMRAYTLLGSTTCGNITRSAIAAGYSERGAHTTGARILRRPEIQARISRLQAEQARRAEAQVMVDAEVLCAEWWRLARVAEDQGILSEARLNLEAIGRARGVFSDHLTIDMPAMRRYADAERVEARRIAGLLIVQDVQAGVVEMTVAERGKDDARAQVRGMIEATLADAPCLSVAAGTAQAALGRTTTGQVDSQGLSVDCPQSTPKAGPGPEYQARAGPEQAIAQDADTPQTAGGIAMHTLDPIISDFASDLSPNSIPIQELAPIRMCKRCGVVEIPDGMRREFCDECRHLQYSENAIRDRARRIAELFNSGGGSDSGA